MSRTRTSIVLLLIAVAIVLGWRFTHKTPPSPSPDTAGTTMSQLDPKPASPPTAAETLLEGYGNSSTPPIEDLRKIHRVVTGYFSLVKDPGRNPIGGIADLSAALRGENPNREVFVREGNPIFTSDGLLKDRWGSPLIVHPEAWRQLELRSAGPDKRPYTEDDLVLTPTGMQPPGR
jgi:hypothetical protein